MIVPPSCKNSKCKNFNLTTMENIIKIKDTKNKYKCTICKKEFTWTMPKKNQRYSLLNTP